MKIILCSWFLFGVAVVGFAEEGKNVHDFTVKDITGEEVELSDYKGRVLVIVNTASKCGHTRKYKDLVKLQGEYADKGLVVMGFPANNFGGQEPGSDKQIMEFCSSTFGVEFPMFSKVSVKGGDKAPLFHYLTTAENPDFTGEINWNFETFLVDGKGVLRHRFRSKVYPSDEDFLAKVQTLLRETEQKTE